jgi:hypothetical protein
LGFIKIVVAPMLIAEFPGLVEKNSLFITGYKYIFSAGGDGNQFDVYQIQIDL